MDSSMDRSRPALRLSQLAWHGLLLVPVIFLALFFVYPLLSIFAVSLAPEGQLDLSGFARLVTSDYYRETLWFTLWQAALSTLLTLAFALPGAYIFVRYRFPGKSLFLSLATLPFVLPTVVVAAAFTALIGPRGLLNTALMDLFALDSPPIQLDRSLTIILIVHIFYNYAVALRIITGFWANQNPRIEEAARILGAHGWRLWWEIRLPILRPAILAAVLLVFMFTFTSFGVVLILGGPRFATLEVEIYRQAANLFNLPVAAALSLVQISFMFVVMLVYTRLQRRIAGDSVSAKNVARLPRTRREIAIITANLAFMIVLLFVPLFALVIRSFTAGASGFTFQYYQLLTTNARNSVLFVPPIQSIGNSLIFALFTTLLAVSLGMLTAYLLSGRASRLSRWLDPLFMLPLATSAVTLGFGYIIALDEPPLNLRTSPILIPLAHTLVAMPFVVRSVLPALRAILPSVQEAARVLGASPRRIWWLVDLPLISRGIVVGATFAFTVSMGEFGASLFIARPDTPTIPIVIFRLLGQPGGSNYGQALAMSVLLMLVSAVGFVLIERLRTAGVGEF
ncbi:MAG: iron ABC transporter permease [Anaerolineae bacterium]|nr:iron ABC transporter permease [Anaerolineae bacterium]